MKMKTDENNYVTSDFCLTTTLITCGFTTVELDKSNSRRILFLFPKSIELQNTVESYWKNAIRVSPQDFFANQRNLKSRMYLE